MMILTLKKITFHKHIFLIFTNLIKMLILVCFLAIYWSVWARIKRKIQGIQNRSFIQIIKKAFVSIHCTKTKNPVFFFQKNFSKPK